VKRPLLLLMHNWGSSHLSDVYRNWGSARKGKGGHCL